MTANLCSALIDERELRSIEEHGVFMRDCTFLSSENHGHRAAKAARQMAASPRPCTNFVAASVLGDKRFAAPQASRNTDLEDGLSF